MGVENLSRRNPIIQKIRQAEEYYLKAKERLSSDTKLDKLLQALESAIQSSRQIMDQAGIIPLCRECEQKEGGSCCGKGLENKYSVTLLLINVLMNVDLPQKRFDPKSCFFLGENGCRLKARHVICVNYLCAKITNSIRPDKIFLLREKEGVELDLLFQVNERVKKLVSPC